MASISLNDREKKRERERKARVRRAANVERMRQTLKGLEGTVLAVRTLDDEVWGRFLNANAMHARRMLLLAKEAKALLLEQTQLHRFLQEHQLSTSCIEVMLAEGSTNSWQQDIERWRELTRRHYTPWTIEDCQAVIDAALREVNAFYWSTDKQSSGLSFLGWCDLRRVDAVQGVFQFQFHKTFRGFDMMDYVNVGWDVFTDARTFKEVLIGPHLMGSHEILQQLTPNIMITRNTERFPSIAGNIHILYLVFRVKTEKGLTQCMRSIDSPELMKAIEGPDDVWASNFIWLQWEELEDEQHEQSYKFHIGGSMRRMDLSHMNQWMLEVFGVVLRSERLATRRQLLTNESSERARSF